MTEKFALGTLVKEWCRQDRDEESRAEIQRLVKEEKEEELEARLRNRLAFGTAGLRGQMGAGFSRLNSLTIIQTSQGLAEYLVKAHTNAHGAGVVIGHDARHNSNKFAQLTAAAFIAKNIRVWWYEDLVHTPMVPFAVQSLEAAAGIMITASHNPAQDNGYKVYGSNGCQINSPVDQSIAASILENLEPISWDFQVSSPLLNPILRQTRSSYQKAVTRYLQAKDVHKVPTFAYTPMHGVGLPYMINMLDDSFDQDLVTTSEERATRNMIVVKEQGDPDPDFSTVRYPNPEENGALDLAKLTADHQEVGLILANDPDADRFAAAENVDGHWRQFTGDEVGVLLAYYILSQLEHKITKDDIMLTSAVSSTMLSHVALREGFTVIETLTGFKWLGNKALEFEKQGKRVHFAYEEALGYMFPRVVHDKDGIVAAGVFLNACASWGSPSQKLLDLHEKYGYFNTMNTYWRSPNVATTQVVFERIRNSDLSGALPDMYIQRKRDLSTGYDSGTTDHKAVLPSSSNTQMITCWLSAVEGKEEEQCEGTKFTIRASGTEPKIKVYLECWDKGEKKALDGAKAVLKAMKASVFYFWVPNLRLLLFYVLSNASATSGFKLTVLIIAQT